MGAVIDRTGYRRLPIGSENFEAVVSQRVYVDKTALIRELIDAAYDVTLFCRPRRFGKSLAMRMLQCYFEAPVEDGPRSIPSRAALFEGLEISRAGARYPREMGAHPVVFLNLGAVGGGTWGDTRAQLAQVVATEYLRHAYLRSSGVMTAEDKAYFARVASGSPDDAELRSSLSWLSERLCRHHGAGTVILIDEYDHPVTVGHLRGYRDEAVSFMRGWLTGALKATTSLRLACLTGVQRVSRESIFSGLNNIVVNTPMDGRFGEGFGFTASEAEELASRCGLPPRRLPQMRDWYDGYCFGGTDVYNPWSVLNYLDQGGVAQPYWGNTSDNAIVHQLFARASGREADELRALAAGEGVTEALDLSTTFSAIDDGHALADSSALWGQLYLAGYVTTDDVAVPNDAMRERRLRVPNREVAYLFRSEFVERSVREHGRDRLRRFREALLGLDADGLSRALDAVLDESPSYLDLTSENSYHMLLLGLLYDVPGYRFPRSNRERGDGRPDVTLEPETENQDRLPAVVIEVKSEGDVPIDEQVQHALAQIERRRYGVGLSGRGLVAWGIAFRGKRALCACRAHEVGLDS